MRAFARVLAVATLTFITAVTIVTPLLVSAYLDRWRAFPQFLFTFSVPVLVLGLAVFLFSGLRSGRDVQPFFSTLGLFVSLSLESALGFTR